MTQPHGVIGDKGRKPWYVSRDLKRFQKLTTPSAVVMGPKTFMSIGKVLPGRLNIIITSNQDYDAPDDVLIAHDERQALDLAAIHNYTEIFAIGGAKVFATFLPLASHLFVTYVQNDIQGDTHFPHWNKRKWHEVFVEEEWKQDPKDTHPTKFAEYGRLAAPPSRNAQVLWRLPD